MKQNTKTYVKQEHRLLNLLVVTMHKKIIVGLNKDHMLLITPLVSSNSPS